MRPGQQPRGLSAAVRLRSSAPRHPRFRPLGFFPSPRAHAIAPAQIPKDCARPLLLRTGAAARLAALALSSVKTPLQDACMRCRCDARLFRPTFSLVFDRESASNYGSFSDFLVCSTVHQKVSRPMTRIQTLAVPCSRHSLSRAEPVRSAGFCVRSRSLPLSSLSDHEASSVFRIIVATRVVRHSKL